MRRLVLNLHLLIAVIAGIFMVIQGITGSIMAFEPELDRDFHSHLSYIRPGTKVLSISEISSTISHRLAGEPIIAYEPSLSPELSSRVLLPSGIAYMNQYTGEVLGIRARGQSFLGYVRDLRSRRRSRFENYSATPQVQPCTGSGATLPEKKFLRSCRC